MERPEYLGVYRLRLRTNFIETKLEAITEIVETGEQFMILKDLGSYSLAFLLMHEIYYGNIGGLSIF